MQSKNSKFYFDKLIKKYSKQITFIYYKPEYGGNLLNRIILSDEAYFWGEQHNSAESTLKPLEYPKSTEGFNVQGYHFLSFKEQHLSCVHSSDIPYPIPLREHDYEMLLRYKEALQNNLKICIKSHRIDEENNTCKGIRLYGKSLSRFSSSETVRKSRHKNVLNINSSKLFSSNYEEFLEEYLKVVRYLDLNPNVNQVRAFILLWIEKQKRFKLS